MNEQDRFRLVNEVGYEAYQLIQKRIQELGQLSFIDQLTFVVGAASVCLANAMRPGVEQMKDRNKAATSLIELSMKQVRAFLDPVVKEQPKD